MSFFIETTVSRVSYKDWRKMSKKGGFRNHKYNAKRTKVDGVNFPSGLQANTYCHLKLLKDAGEIVDIKHEVYTYLSLAKIAFRVDFVVTWKDGSVTYAEAKGFETNEWLIKKKLWKFYGPGRLDIYKGRGKENVYISETIIPKVDQPTHQ